MAQTYYIRQDKSIEGQVHDEFERERDALEKAFEALDQQTSAISPVYTATATVPQTSYLILADATAAAMTLTLPSAGDAGKGKRYLIKKLDSANSLTINSASLIDGAASYIIAPADGKKAIEVISDGTAYYLISSFAG